MILFGYIHGLIGIILKSKWLKIIFWFLPFVFSFSNSARSQQAVKTPGFSSASSSSEFQSFSIRPWVVGQTVTLETKTFNKGEVVDGQTNTYSIVGQEDVKGKKYFWFQIQTTSLSGNVNTQKMQVRRPDKIDFESILGGPSKFLKPRRKIVQSKKRGGGLLQPEELEIPSGSVSQIENEVDPRFDFRFNGRISSGTGQSVTVKAGAFETVPIHQDFSQDDLLPSSRGASIVSAFADSWGSSQVPVLGMVKRDLEWTDPNQGRVTQQTELVSFSEDGATSGITAQPTFVTQSQQQSNQQVGHRSFLIRPWAVGQTVKLKTKVYRNGKLDDVVTETDSVVGKELVKGKDYFWVETEYDHQNGTTVINKSQVPKPRDEYFGNVLNYGNVPFAPRRHLLASASKESKELRVNEYELSSAAVSLVENSPASTQIVDLAGRYKICPPAPVTVEGGTFTALKVHCDLAPSKGAGPTAKPGSAGVSQYVEGYGSPLVPICGVVQKNEQKVNGKNETVLKQTELISFSDSNAVSKVTGSASSVHLGRRGSSSGAGTIGFMVLPWAVGQTVKFETRTFDGGKQVEVETDSYSIVGKESVKGKDYFWVETEHIAPGSPTLVQKIQVRQPGPLDFGSLSGDRRSVLAARRKIQQVAFGGSTTAPSLNELEIPAGTVQEVENGPAPSLVGKSSGYSVVQTGEPISVTAGNFTAIELRRPLRPKVLPTPTTSSSSAAVSQFEQKWGSSTVPIWGLVKGFEQREGPNQEPLLRETELISYSDTGANSQINGKPAFIPYKHQKLSLDEKDRALQEQLGIKQKP